VRLAEEAEEFAELAALGARRHDHASVLEV
jgi:hypothetical protein